MLWVGFSGQLGFKHKPGIVSAIEALAKMAVVCLALISNTAVADSSISDDAFSISEQQPMQGFAAVFVKEGIDKLVISNKARYFEDETRGKSWEWVLDSAQHSLFKSIDSLHVNEGYSQSAFWATFDLKMEELHPVQNIYLEVGHPLLDLVEVFQVQDGQVIHHRKIGSGVTFGERPIDNPSIIFPLSLEQGANYQIYVRVQSEHSIAIPLTLYTKTGLMHHLSTSSSVVFAYFGIMMGVFFYNLFLFFSIKSRAYFYYLLYIVAIVCFQAATMGIGFQSFWPTVPEINLFTPNLFGALSAIAASAFTRNFLQLKNYSGLLDGGFRLLEVGLIFFLPFIGMLPVFLCTNLIVAVTLFGFSWMILSSVYVLSKGHSIARYYLLAWVVMIFFVMIYLGYLFELLPYNVLTFYSMQIGSSIEAVLLSIALADRINIIQKEKDDLQKSSMETLEASNRIKDEFLATISHELRTPINGVQGALELIRLDQPDQHTLSHVDMADESAQHMLALIENILQFSEAQAGNLRIRQEAFDLTRLIKDLQTRYDRQCADKEIDLSIQVAEGMEGYWEGDREIILKCVSILLENAIKFTNAGNILLELSSLPEQQQGQVHLVEIAVSDSGIGISKEQQEYIFRSFKQVDASFSRRYSGLGIGLAVVKQIIELMGGHIQVQSEKGEGSRFALQIPVIRLEQAEAEERLAIETENPLKDGCRRVLVVEDNLVNQTVLKGLLRKLECTVLTAENGVEALKVLESETVDLVFMDCQMPVMDGFTATQAIRKLPSPMCDVPVVAVTANATSKDRDKCLDAGMTDYMKKPVSMTAIEAKVSNYLGDFKVA